MKVKRTLLGIGLIILAALLVLKGIGIIAAIPIGFIVLALVGTGFIIKGIKRRNFFMIFIPAAILANYVLSHFGAALSAVIPGAVNGSFGLVSVVGVAALFSIGMTALFGKRKNVDYNKNNYVNDSQGGNNRAGGFGGAGGAGGFGGGAAGASGFGSSSMRSPGKTLDAHYQDNREVIDADFRPVDDGEYIKIDNGFSTQTRYLNSQSLRQVKIENGFGTCVVYYDNICNAEQTSELRIDNGFGRVDVYIPPFFGFRMKQDNGFGSINVHGAPNEAPDAPIVDAKIKNGMGQVNIYFG